MTLDPRGGGHGGVPGFGDFGNPFKTDCDVQIFNANTDVDQKGLQRWIKPRRSSMHYMFVLGPGAGGGGGHTRSAGNAGSGGGGGSSGSLARLIIPSIHIPDELYIQVPNGGTGGAASSFGSNGLQAWIGFNNKSKATASPIGVLLISDNNGPATGGGPGGAGSAGSGGGAGTVAAQVTWLLWGFFGATVGSAGTGGGAQTGAAGTNQTTMGSGNALQLTGGCGGGGCTSANFDGGSVNISGGIDWGMGINYPSTGSVPGGTGTTNIHGSPGISRIHPLIVTGGGGGAAVNAAPGGNGGNGGYGCGGGGGGAGTTGGKGGNGGPGLVIIYSW